MSTSDRKQQLRSFLSKFDEFPVVLSSSTALGLMQQFIVTYFGMCHVEGYRIIEKLGENVFVLMRMGLTMCASGGRGLRIVSIEYKDQIKQDRQLRQEKYRELLAIIAYFCPPQSASNSQIHFLFAHNFKYSQLSPSMLRENRLMRTRNFYEREYCSEFSRTGLKILKGCDQGTRLHEIVELYLKGADRFCNMLHMRSDVLHQVRFDYCLQKIINNVCLVVGREMVEGGYSAFSVEKWMRKYSKARFKRFDFLLRGDRRVCIIDWKFSRNNADRCISSTNFRKKNEEYVQLARKQYNAEVELKYYCFHQCATANHHKYTTDTYNYSIQSVDVNEEEEIGQKRNEIEIDDSISLSQSEYDAEIVNEENWWDLVDDNDEGNQRKKQIGGKNNGGCNRNKHIDIQSDDEDPKCVVVASPKTHKQRIPNTEPIDIVSWSPQISRQLPTPNKSTPHKQPSSRTNRLRTEKLIETIRKQGALKSKENKRKNRAEAPIQCLQLEDEIVEIGVSQSKGIEQPQPRLPRNNYLSANNNNNETPSISLVAQNKGQKAHQIHQDCVARSLVRDIEVVIDSIDKNGRGSQNQPMQIPQIVINEKKFTESDIIETMDYAAMSKYQQQQQQSEKRNRKTQANCGYISDDRKRSSLKLKQQQKMKQKEMSITIHSVNCENGRTEGQVTLFSPSASVEQIPHIIEVGNGRLSPINSGKRCKQKGKKELENKIQKEKEHSEINGRIFMGEKERENIGGNGFRNVGIDGGNRQNKAKVNGAKYKERNFGVIEID